jgi:hypothetical protein
MDISRRKLARSFTGIVAGAAAATTAAAQAPQQPAADTELESVRSAQRAAAETIAKVPLPMTTEPAVYFKA